MAEFGGLYGAPNGILASEEMLRQNALAGANIRKIAGDLEKIPYEIEHLKAQTEHQYALSGMNREQAMAAQAKRAQEEQIERISQQVAARRAYAEQLKAAGIEPTVANLRNGQVPDNSPLTQMGEVIKELQAQGVSESLIAPLTTKYAEAYKDFAAGESSKSTTALNQQKMIREIAENAGALAQHGLKGPREYAEMLAAARSDPLKAEMVRGLPPVYGPAAVGRLRQMLDESVTVKQQADMAARQQEANAATARAAAANTSAAAALMNAKSQVEFRNFRKQQILKADGPGSSDAKDARTELTRARTEEARARNLVRFPPAPLDPGARTLKKIYTGSDGKRYMWDQDASGKRGWVAAPRSAAEQTDEDD